ncbi:hypothetical protein L2E82_41548 [Cichorium intybus]|uniref:Uncharacterized protein n=1 Tax=Cichorium intybus TaxID=13427 RepID=A0ACB9ANL9_CICIN|nr:hypothetical protein L2E82_41548 [Cichorium intybus]
MAVSSQWERAALNSYYWKQILAKKWPSILCKRFPQKKYYEICKTKCNAEYYGYARLTSRVALEDMDFCIDLTSPDDIILWSKVVPSSSFRKIFPIEDGPFTMRLDLEEKFLFPMENVHGSRVSMMAVTKNLSQKACIAEAPIDDLDVRRGLWTPIDLGKPFTDDNFKGEICFTCPKEDGNIIVVDGLEGEALVVLGLA